MNLLLPLLRHPSFHAACGEKHSKPYEACFPRGILDVTMPSGVICPVCGCKRVVRNGRRNGLQRYRCKMCTRCFTELTGTIFEGLHCRDQFIRFSACMMRGLSVRASAREVGVSKNTSFKWRHRIISRLLEADSKVKLDGIVEIAQQPLVICRKGQRLEPGRLTAKSYPRSYGYYVGMPYRFQKELRAYLIVAVDRGGRVRAEVIMPQNNESVGGVMREIAASSALVCATREPGMLISSRDYPDSICWVGPNKGRIYSKDIDTGDPVYHVSNARWLRREFRDWMRKFNGVATKYIPRYAAWFWRVLEFGNLRGDTAATALLLSALNLHQAA